MFIRKATIEHVQDLARLAKRSYSHAFGHTMEPEQLRIYLSMNCSTYYFEKSLKSDTVLFAENDGHMLGYVTFGDIGFEFEGTARQDQELHRLYVDPSFQGKGIGKGLLKDALDDPRLLSVASIYLKVNAQNDVAISLYRTFGFEVIGKAEFVVDSHVLNLDLVMARFLPALLVQG